MILPAAHVESGPIKKVWAEFNKLRSFAQSIQPIAGKNVRIDRTSLGSVIRTDAVAGEAEEPGVDIKRLTINAAYANYIACTEIGSSEIINVAKPWQLRKSSYDGRTVGLVRYSYTSAEIRTLSWTESNLTLTVVEEMDPSYGVGTYLYAAKLADDTEIKDTEESAIEWIDLNVDARHWRPSYRTYLLCQDNALYRAKFAAGAAVRVP